MPSWGQLKGTFEVAQNSITNPTSTGAVVTGSGAVDVGDLVYVVVGEQTSATVTGVTDNLGNTYTATQAAADAGTSTGRAFYSRVTTAGTITNIDVAATGSSQNVAVAAAIFSGPFATSPLDANPTNATTDVTSPFTGPATGTLAQIYELVVSWSVSTGNAVFSASSPNLKAEEIASQAILSTRIGYQSVAATTTVSPEWTGTNPTDQVLGTSSFMVPIENPPIGNRCAAVALATALVIAHAAPPPLPTLNGRLVQGAVVVTADQGVARPHPRLVEIPDPPLPQTGARIAPLILSNKTLATDAGSYSITGTDAAPKHAWLLSAGVGSYSLTGTDAALKHGWKVSADAGSYAISGTDAALRHAWVLPASAGSYVVTGTSADLLHAWKLFASGGSYTIGGSDAGLSVAGTANDPPFGHRERAIELASTLVSAWTPAPPLPTLNRKLVQGAAENNPPGASRLRIVEIPDPPMPQTGARVAALLAPVGDNPPFRAYRFHTWQEASPVITEISGGGLVSEAAQQPYARQFDFTAFLAPVPLPTLPRRNAAVAASVLTNKTLSAEAGSYAITGTAASLLHGWKLAAAVGSYAITGTNASLLHGWKIAGDAGSYSLTGANASLLHAWKLSAAAGSYTINGTDVSLVKTRGLIADAGSYAITGSTASLLWTHKLAANAGSYTITGTDVTLRAGPPVVDETARSGGWIVPHSFTRKRWRELLEEIQAEITQVEQAAVTATKPERKRLNRAAQVATQALEELKQADETAALAEQANSLRLALDAASDADRTKKVFEQADRAVKVAQAILREIEEEEEAVLLLTTF